MLAVLGYVAAAIALVLVASYYLLASIPFSYYHFIQVPQLWWLPAFIALHPFVLAAALAALLARTAKAPAPVKAWVRYVALGGAATAACMLALEAVPAAQSYELSAALSFLPLLLLVAANVVNLAASGDHAAPLGPAPDAAAWVGAGALAGALTGLAYAADSAQRGAASTLARQEFAAAATVSVAAHVVGFALAAVVVVAVRRLAARRGVTPSIERVVLAVCGTALIAMLIRRSLLPALILGDLRAAFVALTLAAAVATTAWAAARRAPAGGHEPRRGRAGWMSAGALIVLIVVLPRVLLLADWGGSLQKILAMLAWVASLAWTAQTAAGRPRARRALVLGVVALLAASTAIVGARRNGNGHLDLGLAVDRYATFDASLGVLLDAFRPVLSDDAFFRTLRAAGDVTDDRSLTAVRLSLKEGLQAPAGRPPNVFIVVVDSLRPDYVSAYNPAATFTPAIGAFANESIVMRRAFTQYAGTALSQPALWAGGLIQRAMYVKPFAAVDNLERLGVAAGYRRYVSVDPPLSAILEDWSGLVRLDAHLHPDRRDEEFKFDLCRTVPDLVAHLDADGAGRPIFFYSQPQNVHIRTLAGDAYPGTIDQRVTIAGAPFFKPAVTALTRLDGCFGALIDALKARGLYDDSIVVLTSDHGDSYGEAGRWAHAFYMAPETLRIPLILHVPAKYLEGRTVARDEVAALTDVTPTLYDLLGYAPLESGDLLGRPLFPRAGSARAPRALLVQSSYSRVFGLLDGEARWMYVADANHYREELFDLTGTDTLSHAIGAADRVQYRKWLLERLDGLNRFYGHQPK